MSSALFDACQREQSKRVKALMDEKVSTFTGGNRPLSPSPRVIQYDVTQLDEQGRSALHYCAESSDAQCARLLLADDAGKVKLLDLQDNEGCSALHLGKLENISLANVYCIRGGALACMNGNEAMVRFLCEQGANVKLVDNESHSLIHWITGTNMPLVVLI